MKKMKKLASLVLALAMALTLAVPAFAAPVSTTISVAAEDNRTYEIYQIFVGDLAGGVLSNLKWGENGTGTKDTAVDESVVDELVAVSTATDIAKLNVITEYVNMGSTPIATIGKGQSASSATVLTGYYLMKDVTENLGEGEEHSTFVVEVVGAVTVSPKVDDTTMIKKVKDVNDSTGGITDWQDSADYDIGDDVPFQLTSTITNKYDFYTSYYYAFHDNLSDGLQFNPGSVKVYVDGNEIKTGFEVKTQNLTHATCDFEVVFANLKAVTAVKAGSKITLEYTAKLTGANVVIGSDGNPNTAYLEYSNDPYGNGKGRTPDDTVIVFTYKLEANKVTKNPNYDPKEENSKEFISLTGAGFTLYKKQPVKDETGNVVKNEDGTVKYDYQAVGSEVTGEAMTTFEWKGLDDGDYKLVETTTPPGYNTIAPIEFTITAEHEVLSDNPDLTNLEGGNKFTGEVSSCTLTTSVVNESGATLPETGGMGTTLFYALGAVLVIGAGVAMVTKKRMA